MEDMRYLTFALGKGRLAKKTLELFEKIGITCEEMKDKDTRKLIFVNEELKLRFFLAKGPDVPTYVEYGAADIGIVGKDTILEEGRNIYEVLDLGFGKCRMCICGPKDAEELLKHHELIRVATKYPHIAKDYFYNKKHQTVEIIKVLYRGADILILDEPTAVLTPQETDRLFDVMRNMKADGKALVIITHKLHEVMDVSDRVAVLRKGRYIGDVATCDTSPQKLTDMMVGHAVTLNIDRPLVEDRNLRLEVKDLTVLTPDSIKALDHVSFDAYGGEILGIAGISGSGQKELLEAIAGLRVTQPGSHVIYHPPAPDEPIAGQHVPVDKGGEELLGKNPRQIHDIGVSMAFVPEDRLGMGLVGSMGMADNMMLKTYRSGRGPLLDRKPPRQLAERVKEELDVLTPSINTPVRRLSGGNVQKVLVGREIAQNPSVLMTAYAVRGLDINTSYTIYNLLTAQKLKGVAVIYVGEDLDVLLELCDRILVLCGGQVSGIVDGRTTTKEEVGLLMTRFVKEAKEA